jgi:hypothetical protein
MVGGDAAVACRIADEWRAVFGRLADLEAE